jgi:DnaJ-domain-containing protein 1
VSSAAYYIWLIILIIYIISPRDLFPGFIDDIIALGAIMYIRYRNARQRGRAGYSGERRGPHTDAGPTTAHGLSLNEAYDLLGVDRNATWEEIRKAYREKIAKSHPDKVSHLSEELQEKAKELTLKLNKAIDLIKRYKGPV